MKLPALAIKYRHFIMVLLGITIIIGVRSFMEMPKSEDPFLNLPIYNVTVVYPGATVLDMESLVVEPVEKAIDQLDGIVEIRTKITEGLAIIRVQGQYNTDYDKKYNEIVAEVNTVKTTLPTGIYDLQVTQYKPEDRTAILQYAIGSKEASYSELETIAERFENELKDIEGVKKTKIVASPVEEIHVTPDLHKMNVLGIPLDLFIRTLRANNLNVPLGSIDAGSFAFNIQSTGKINTLDDIDDILVRSSQNHVVRVKDIATVHKGYEDLKWTAKFNGHRCILLTVYQNRDANIIQLSGKIDEVYKTFQKGLTGDVFIEKAFEQASAVKDRINGFIGNLVQGIILVGMVVWLFLGFRSGGIVMALIPLSIMIAVVLLHYSGFALQQISIAALVIALGLLVDNAIVVIENIIRLNKEGMPIQKAAIKGTSEVGFAIISSTITTILAFLPLALLDSGPGEYLKSLPLTVIFALLASLLLALVVTPILASKILKEKKRTSKNHAGMFNQIVSRFYRPILIKSLKKGWVVVTVALLLLLGALALFPKIGVSFFPNADKNLLLVNIDLPYSANETYTEEAANYVQQILDTTPYVKNYTTNIGHGNPQVYYNRVPEEYKKYHGEILINFHKWDADKFYGTLNQLNKAFKGFPDARIHFRELKNGSPFEAPIEILIKGDHLDTIHTIAGEVEAMVTEAGGTKDVKNPMAHPKKEISLKLNKEKMARYHLLQTQVDHYISTYVRGLQIDEFIDKSNNKNYPIVIKPNTKESTTLQMLQSATLLNSTGDLIPFSQFADIEFMEELAELSHFNTKRAVGITANVYDTGDTKNITETIIDKLDAYPWPKGYTYYVGGEYETQQQSFGDLSKLLLLALLAIFAVLVLQFRSLIQPLIIFAAIPLAVTGSFIALFLTGWSFSFFAFVGFISLIGIVVNNSIILVDYTNQLMDEGMQKPEAILTACTRRFTPIVLTTLTTILGLIPLTLSGTTLWSPLGWTLIGGLISSMMLTLLVVPVLYNWFTKQKS